MATFPILSTIWFAFAAYYVVYAQPLRRAVSSGGIPVRIVREGNNQVLSVSSEGAVFSNGSNSERDTRFLLSFSITGTIEQISLTTTGRIELESSKYEGVFIGIAEDGSVKAAPKCDLYAYTFETTDYIKTLLPLVDTDVECALRFTDDGIAQNACYSDMESGSGSGNKPIISNTKPDLFTLVMDFACL